MPKYVRFAAYIAILAIALYYYFMPTAPQRAPRQAETAMSVDAGNLDVRREPIQGAFERTPYKLVFDFTPLDDGRSRVMGRSADGHTVLELIGPPENLTTATMMANMPDDNKLAQVRNLNALMMLAEMALPNWPSAEDWVGTNIPVALESGQSETTIGGKNLSLRVAPGSKTVVFTVVGPPKTAAPAAP